MKSLRPKPGSAQLLSVLGAGLVALVLGAPTFADIAEGIGGLPGQGSGDEWSAVPMNRSATMYLQGPQHMVSSTLLEVQGDGEVETSSPEPGQLRLVFRGALELRLDELYLTNGVELGVEAAHLGGVQKTVFVWEDGTRSGVIETAPGNSLPVSIPRMHALGLLEEPVTMYHRNQITPRTTMRLSSAAGVLDVRLDP